jgi:hypothetical protein
MLTDLSLPILGPLAGIDVLLIGWIALMALSVLYDAGEVTGIIAAAVTAIVGGCGRAPPDESASIARHTPPQGVRYHDCGTATTRPLRATSSIMPHSPAGVAGHGYRAGS